MEKDAAEYSPQQIEDMQRQLMMLAADMGKVIGSSLVEFAHSDEQTIAVIQARESLLFLPDRGDS